VWTYQWYFTPEGSAAEQLILGANASEYNIQDVGCGQKGTCRVEANCSDGYATACGQPTQGYVYVNN
jgi:hypothetical protein